MSRNEGVNDARTMALKIGAVVLAAILLLSIGFLLLSVWEKHNSDFLEDMPMLDDTLSYNGKDYVLKDQIETILVLGLDTFESEDSGSYNNDKQADFLLLYVIDNAAKTCKAIHINRDTMTEMNILGVAGDKVGTVTKQIALSHTYGNGREVSCRNTANAVSKLLMGVEIDHYVSVTMDAVPVYNDFIGGVTLEVLDDFTGIDDTLVKGETVTLRGEQALHYVRSRYGLEDPTNSSRMVRQRQYLEALYAQTMQCIDSDADFAVNASIAFTDYIVSDCSANQLATLFEKISGYDFKGIHSLEGTSRMGESYLEFYADADSIKKIIVDLFYEEKM